jgi:hypothetical protein
LPLFDFAPPGAQRAGFLLHLVIKQPIISNVKAGPCWNNDGLVVVVVVVIGTDGGTAAAICSFLLAS